jgi:23S rRNA pseudouridine1911/1915/1917 synthase
LKDTQFIISTDLQGAEVTDADPGSDEVDRRSFVVDIDGHGQRVDKVLAQAVAGFSRSYLQQLVARGDVSVNDRAVSKSSLKLRIGDCVAIALRATEQSKAFVPEAMALDVVYEDEDLLVINKPAGLVVHPAPGNWTGTLLNGLLAYHPCFSEVPRAGIVHRLDKDTSGLMVVAKRRLVMDALVAAIARRDVGRQYLAIAKGNWPFGSPPHSVEAPIGRDPVSRLRMAVVDLTRQAGKEAKTEITCLDQSATAVLVHCRLHTGRTHQIRVHMASIKLPLVADAVYGGPKGAVIERQALHATRLTFVHPVKGSVLTFLSLPPSDFMAELSSLSLRYNENMLPCAG